MKAVTYIEKIQKENCCSVQTAENLTKALHREELLDKNLIVRFRPLYGDFDILHKDWFTNHRNDIYYEVGDIDNLMKTLNRIKLDKFLLTEFGSSMVACVEAWDDTLSRISYNDLSDKMIRLREDCSCLQARWEVYKMALKYIFGVDYHFTRTDEYFGICTADESEWLIKKERRNLSLE